MRRGLVGESLEKFFSLLNTFTWGQKHAVVLLTQLCAEVMLVVDTGLWHPCANKPTCADTVCWGESQFKMATQEDPELTFSHTKSTQQIYTTNLQVHMEYLPPKENLKISWWHIYFFILSEGEKVHMETGGEAVTQSQHKPQPQCSPQSGGNSNTQLLLKDRRIWDPHQATPTFKTCTWGTSPQNI